jgi:Flp pilus assembly pilin Flp
MPVRLLPVGAAPASHGRIPLASEIRAAIIHVKARRLWREDEGKDMVEYGLLIMLISLGAITALVKLASVFRFFASHASSAQSVR